MHACSQSRRRSRNQTGADILLPLRCHSQFRLILYRRQHRCRHRRSTNSSAEESSLTKPEVTPAKAKIVETIRVESDRLDHLMNLAGELVITKARFVAIARGLDELFRGSNARALTSDTRERLESLTRGLEGLTEIKSGFIRWFARPLVSSRPPAP